jgi:hypothetical protein
VQDSPSSALFPWKYLHLSAFRSVLGCSRKFQPKFSHNMFNKFTPAVFSGIYTQEKVNYSMCALVMAPICNNGGHDYIFALVGKGVAFFFGIIGSKA